MSVKKYKMIVALMIFSSGSFAQDGRLETPRESDMDFAALHQRIFSTQCAIAACHDGSFEPDFRTVQSAYYTLVFHPIVKNDERNGFNYRVVPFDTAKSLLLERLTNCCFVNDGDQMPFADDNISEDELGAISSWIMAGAPDWKGMVSKPVDKIPAIDHRLIVLGITDRGDTLQISREKGENIRLVPENITSLILKFKANDDLTAPKGLSKAKANFYRDLNFHDLSFSKVPNYYNGFWITSVNIHELRDISELYIQFEVNDGINEQSAKLPPTGFSWLKMDWAFKLETSLK